MTSWVVTPWELHPQPNTAVGRHFLAIVLPPSAKPSSLSERDSPASVISTALRINSSRIPFLTSSDSKCAYLRKLYQISPRLLLGSKSSQTRVLNRAAFMFLDRPVHTGCSPRCSHCERRGERSHGTWWNLMVRLRAGRAGAAAPVRCLAGQ